MKKKFLPILMVLMVICQGCVAAFLAGGAVAGIMVYSYIRGELERKYPADFPTTWQATMKTIEELEFEIDKTNKDAITGEIQCHRANGTAVWIKLQMDTAEITIVRIRIGTEGDRNISEFIHEKIRQNLKLTDEIPYDGK